MRRKGGGHGGTQGTPETNKTVSVSLFHIKMNSLIGTIADKWSAWVSPLLRERTLMAIAAAIVTTGSVKPPVKNMLSIIPDPYSEMEKGHVLEWWPSQQS
jgi:hypothetical protein